MRLAVRSIGVALFAILATVLLALTSSMTTVSILAAATYALPGLLAYPFGTDATTALATPYITGIIGGPPPPLVVLPYTSLPPPDAIESGSVVFGISQGAQDASNYKKVFNRHWADDGGDPPDIKVIVLGNPARPNGGNASRMDVAAAAPTERVGADGITTYDVARQYDPVADAPTNPTNLLAVVNGSMGFLFGHIGYAGVDMSQAILQETHGDTNFYLIPTYPLPLLIPLEVIPGIGHVLADSLDPPLRVLIEAAYDRTISPSEPTLSNPNYFPDATALADNLRLAMSVGRDNWSENLGQGRPLGTERPGPYGVGGPPVALQPSENPPAQPQDPQVRRNTTTLSPATLSPAESLPTQSAPVDEGSGTRNTEPSNVTATTPSLKHSMTGANARRPLLSERGPSLSPAPTRGPVLDDGNDRPVKGMLDSSTTGLESKSGEPSEPDSASDDSSGPPSST